MKSSESDFRWPCLDKPVRITEQVWPEGTSPMVSVYCITYNHLNYIRDAIDSFLNQETTFPVEIFIHDDASNDGTAHIIQDYLDKYPKLFWTVLQTENQYSKERFKFFFDYFSKQRGKFIALCEGDDYWICSSKLENQFKIMESHPEASFCFHNTLIVDECGVEKGEWRAKERVLVHSIEELFSSNFIHTSSIFFRRSSFYGLPPILKSSPFGDWPLCILLAENGPYLYLDEIMSHYRLHSASNWSTKKQVARLEYTCNFFQLLLIYFKNKKSFRQILRMEYKKQCMACSRLYKSEKKFLYQFYFYLKSRFIF